MMLHITKKKILFIFLILPVLMFGSSFRLSGMNGQYYLPDQEFDITINPAFLSSIGGIYIISDLNLKIIHAAYTYSNHSVFTQYSYNHTGKITENSLDLTGTRLGMLMNFKNIGVGLILTPHYYYYIKTSTYTDTSIAFTTVSNSTTNTQNYSGQKTSNSCFCNYDFIFSYDFGAIQLGLKGFYTLNPLKTLGGNLGGMYSINNSIKMGVSGTYAIIARRNNTALFLNSIILDNYHNWLDVLLIESGYNTGGTILFDYTLPGNSLLRFLLVRTIISKKAAFQSTDDFQKTYSTLSNMSYNKTENKLEIKSKVSYSKTFDSALWFSGLTFSFNNNNTLTDFDNDTTAHPTNQTMQYKTTDTSTSFNTIFTFGAEGTILKWLTIRGGITSTLFSYIHNTTKMIDAHDASTNVVDTVRKNTKSSDISFFNSCTFVGGATFKLSSKMNIDIYSGISILGMNYDHNQSESEDTIIQEDQIGKNSKDILSRLDFKINIGFSYLL